MQNIRRTPPSTWDVATWCGYDTLCTLQAWCSGAVCFALKASRSWLRGKSRVDYAQESPQHGLVYLPGVATFWT